jgi:hypothetical protein
MADAKKPTVAPAAQAPAAPATTGKKEILPGGWSIPIPDGAEFGGLPEGTYLCKCEIAPTETVSGKGDPQTEFTYVIHDPAYADLEGRTVKYWCSRKPKAWWNIEQTLTAMDVPFEILKDAAGKPISFHFNPIQCVGTWAKAVVAPNTNPQNGVVRNRVAQIISVNESATESSGGEETSGGDQAPF